MRWKNRVIAQTASHLRKRLGPPDDETRDSWYWYLPAATIVLRNEYIAHTFPRAHHDFVYTTAKTKLTAKQAARLPLVTGSIIVDGLKHEVTARCGDLTANAVTLSFVDDQSKLANASQAELKHAASSTRLSTSAGSGWPNWMNSPRGARERAVVLCKFHVVDRHGRA